MQLEGMGGGFLKGAPRSEMVSMTENLVKLEAYQSEKKQLVVRVAEVNGTATATGTAGSSSRAEDLMKRLKSIEAKAAVIASVVERQKTIEHLWAEPAPPFRRKAAEVRELEGRLALIGDG
jgi:hypothetical protein